MPETYRLESLSQTLGKVLDMHFNSAGSQLRPDSAIRAKLRLDSTIDAPRGNKAKSEGDPHVDASDEEVGVDAPRGESFFLDTLGSS